MALYDPQKGRRKIYKYDKVFGVDSTQVEVYEDTKALIRSVLDGLLPFNACPLSLRACPFPLAILPKARECGYAGLSSPHVQHNAHFEVLMLSEESQSTARDYRLHLCSFLSKRRDGLSSKVSV